MRLRRLLLPIVVLFVLPPSAAAGDGPPTSRDAGPDGVMAPGGRTRLTALPASSRSTVLARSETSGGRVRQVALLRRTWGVPVVAFDGTAGGLSADARTLVLMQPAKTLPRRLARFAVVNARALAVRQKIVLRGDWSFDALSPDASTLYLTEDLNRSQTRYAVRAYDLLAHRLVKAPVVDPSEPDEPLRGWPVTRTTGPGGHWEYTLYAGGGKPFIHALDTVHRTSICIDLPRRIAKPSQVWQLRLELRGPQIAVVYRHKLVASVARRPQQASTGGGPPWLAAIVAATGLLALAGVRRARRGAA